MPTSIKAVFSGAGSVGLLLAVVGCVGAWREKATMVNTYAVFLTMIAVCKYLPVTWYLEMIWQ
jgi:hypothetical protein